MVKAADKAKFRPKPFLFPQFCKACGRCIEACPKHCIHLSDTIDPLSGLRPVVVDVEVCNGCGLCFDACPEPFGLLPADEVGDMSQLDPEAYFGPRATTAPTPELIPDEQISLPEVEPIVLKGTHAAAVGALLGGCRHFFGYPITPSTEGAELMAKLLPQLGGVFVQAVSEVATVNLMYGCGGAGLRCTTFTSSPGFSLMLEGISYMIGAEIPAVFMNVMRGGPGLGNIAPEQADIKLACRGLGHGNTHALVLAPYTPQEMVDLTMQAFDLAFHYRNPVIVLADGDLGQMTGRVTLPRALTKPGIPEWAVYGDEMHRGNVHTSIYISEVDLEPHNLRLNQKYERIVAHEQRADLFHAEGAEWLIVACNTPARMSKGAVQALRERGVNVGLFRPISLWPFPIRDLEPLIPQVRGLIVVEAGPGQLEDEVRLALSHANLAPPPITRVRRYGGVIPRQQEIEDAITALTEAHHG